MSDAMRRSTTGRHVDTGTQLYVKSNRNKYRNIFRRDKLPVVSRAISVTRQFIVWAITVLVWRERWRAMEEVGRRKMSKGGRKTRTARRSSRNEGEMPFTSTNHNIY